MLIGVGLLNSAICSDVDVQLGPSCNQTGRICFDNATCDETNDICVCDNFFVMSGDWTKCLPLAAMPYDSTCEENSQCPPRMGQGANCSEGKCVCKDGFHYLHGKCYKSSGYGDLCNEDDDCYGAFSYESMSCVATKCNCSEGYYLVGSSYCRRGGKIDEECVFDMDCQFAGGYCNDTNICASKNTKDQNVYLTGTSKVRSPADLSTEFPAVNLTGTCETSEECLAATNHSECFGNVCVCELGYSDYQNSGSCRPDLGEHCSEEGNFSYISNAECRDNLIRCKAPYIITENNRECKIGRLFGTQCQVQEQCRYSGDHAKCVPNGNRNMCQCAVDYHFVEEIDLCVQTKGVGKDCEKSYECVVTSGKVDCTDSVCACLEGFHETKGDCVQDVKALYDPCVDNTDCTRAIDNTSCVNSICQCSKGYFANTTTYTSCITGIGGDCTNNNECNAVQSAFCNDTALVCECNGSAITSSGYNKCLNGSLGFGDECEEVSQCSELLGTEGSVCAEGICTCKEDYHFRNALCRKKIGLGDVCEQNSQCYVKSEEMDKVNKVECRNRLCQCRYAYTQTLDLDCKSGVSGQSASFGFVIGALMVVLLGQTKWN